MFVYCLLSIVTSVNIVSSYLFFGLFYWHWKQPELLFALKLTQLLFGTNYHLSGFQLV